DISSESNTMFTEILAPWKYIAISTYFLFYTILKLILAADFRTLFSRDSFNDAWFGNFWAYNGPMVKADAEPKILPLLQGRIRHGKIHDEPQVAPVSGKILEIGAGSGMWADVLATVTKDAKGPLKIYGVEPNVYSAAALKQRTQDVGLGDVYEVLPVGIEKLTETNCDITPGSVDCIVTIQCLCSIPEPEKNARLLYNYLKKGGRWYVYEHVKAENGFVIPWFQELTNKVWTRFMSTCNLCRPTAKILSGLGEWEDFSLSAPIDQSPYDPIPRVMGVLTK
ncbi:hypothetical protein jhhlp_007916, partial [Lomentospora prolificans]